MQHQGSSTPTAQFLALRAARRAVLGLGALVAATPLLAQGHGGGAVAPGGQQTGLRRTPAPLVVGPGSLAFFDQEVGTLSQELVLTLENVGAQTVTVDSLALGGFDPAEFSFTNPSGFPFDLAPGATEDVSVTYGPTFPGPAKAFLDVAYAGSSRHASATMNGFGTGALGEEVLVNAGGAEYVDGAGDTFIADFGGFDASPKFTPDPIEGTVEDDLYRHYVQGFEVRYGVPMSSGWYAVTLHFVEPEAQAAGERVFDVSLEGLEVSSDLDLFDVVGHDVAYTETHLTEVVDGSLDLLLKSVQGRAVLAAFEIRRAPVLQVTPGNLDFTGVEAGQTLVQDLTLTNVGALPLTLETVSLELVGKETAEAFQLDFDGALLDGQVTNVSYPVSYALAAGQELVVPVTFAPLVHDVFQAYVDFSGPEFESAGSLLYGLAGQGHPFLHVVIDAPGTVVDYDVDGFADTTLDGTLSHTHEFGKNLVGFDWTEGATPLGSGPLLVAPLAIGDHTVTLTITDDNVPPETLAADVGVKVVPLDAIPGVMARYYDGSGTPPATLIDSVPAKADFAEVREDWFVNNDGTAGGSPFTGLVMVVLEGEVAFDTEGTYVITPAGGDEQRLFVDGVSVTTPVALTAGTHSIEARFAVTSLATLPIRVNAALQGQPLAPLPAEDTTHDQTGIQPVINSMPAVGSTLGGNEISIRGLGFFPADQVTVNWGGLALTEVDFDSMSATEIVFTSPPQAAGTISVSVTTPAGTSLAKSFSYTEDGPVPIVFELLTSYFVQDPTSGDWGPDGRFYVASRLGQITAFEFDANYNLLSSQTYPGVSGGLPANEVLGICFNPFDDPEGPVRIYVARSDLFAQGGSSFAGPAPYDGKISILEGPDFDTPIDLVTGLPLSNHDHGINGMLFDNNGDLLFSVGGNTNAGVQWPTIGDIPETPLSAAICKALTSRPDFNGAVTYVDKTTGLPDANANDMVYGDTHRVADGVHVVVHSPGHRNAYDIALTTKGYLFATDNGPNTGFGPASTGPDTEGTEPQKPDEINLVEYGRYYGHPNRNRGEANPAENVYHTPTDPAEPWGHTPPLAALPSSTDGICEYRARSFGSQLRGDLLTQQWGNMMKRIKLGPDGKTLEGFPDLKWTGSLDVQIGPAGHVMAMNYGADSLKIYQPQDLSLVGLRALDIFPWRAPATGGAKFTIGGFGFGDLQDTTVTIGGLPAELDGVSPTRITGTVPTRLDPDYTLQNVVVTVGGESDTIVNGFYFLGPEGSEPGKWEDLTDMPTALGEVAAAEIGGLIYVVGEGSSSTYRYNTNTNVWPSTVAQRPFVGHHHSAEVYDGKMYLIGGLGAGEGVVQIFDPALNQWSLGASMPWNGGSVSTALIDGKIYAAGGIVGSTTVDNCAVYDPELDTWTSLTPMPAGEGRNHAAAGTDGEKLWIFGGRGVGSGECNCVANGFDTIHVYDPQTDTWESSLDPGSTLTPMPVGRGGTGKAIWHQGEFYIMGGETLNGPGAVAGNVYARVDVYDPEFDTWRQDRDMLVPRHGHYPVLFQGKIYVAGGGTQAAFSQSTAMDLLSHQ